MENHHLLQQLHRLAADADADAAALTHSLDELTSGLRAAVSGYVGVAITLAHPGQAVTLAAVEARLAEAVTSLRLPLALLSPGFDEGSIVLVYSTTPGSLVDLAADLRYALARPSAVQLDVELDVELPPSVSVSGVTGLTELATIHRATGVLIDQGHDPDTVLDLFRRQALAAGVAVHVVAAGFLP